METCPVLEFLKVPNLVFLYLSLVCLFFDMKKFMKN